MPSIDVGGLNLWYESQGEGHAIVFLHAFATTSEMWVPQVRALATAGYRVLRVDLRGHGDSSSPPGPYSVSDLALDVHRLIQNLDLGKVCLVGLSTGGRVATRLVLEYPQDIAELVLVSTKSEPALDIRNELRELAEIALQGKVDTAVEQFYTNHYQLLSRAAPDLVNKILSGWRGKPGDGFAGVAIAISEMDSVTSRVCEITAPTLAMAGQLDPPCHPFLAWYERSMANCHGVIIPDAGHFVNVEKPDFFNRILIEFLAAQPA